MFSSGIALLNERSFFRALASILLGVLLGGCELFSPKPALPRQAASAANPDELMSAVARADIIYFPIETFGPAEHPVWKIMALFKRRDESFSIAWQGIEIDQQSILEEVVGKPDQLEKALDLLDWSGVRSNREYSKSILRATPGIRHMAIGAPRLIEAKIRSGTRLNSEERGMVPHGYQAPPNGLANFMEEFASRRRLPGAGITNLYHAHLFAEQFAAERIVAFMRENAGIKLLVFVRKQDMGGQGDLAYFVAQKLRVRQIKVEVNPRGRTDLITSSRSGVCSVACL
jgi:hypothetical protein